MFGWLFLSCLDERSFGINVTQNASRACIRLEREVTVSSLHVFELVPSLLFGFDSLDHETRILLDLLTPKVWGKCCGIRSFIWLESTILSHNLAQCISEFRYPAIHLFKIRKTYFSGTQYGNAQCHSRHVQESEGGFKPEFRPGPTTSTAVGCAISHHEVAR